MLEVATRQRLLKTQRTKKTVRAVVNFRMCVCVSDSSIVTCSYDPQVANKSNYQYNNIKLKNFRHSIFKYLKV
jgi:hypothetical protein